MVTENSGVFATASRGKTGIIYVPSDLTKDSAWPFKDGERLSIRIEGERLIIEKGKKGKA
jgi:hypothetical protein